MGYSRLYLAPVTRTLVVAALVLLVAAGPAATATEEFRIVVVPGLDLEDLRALSDRGAVGVLVPANGRSTSGAQARAALVRGKLRPSYLGGGIPGGAPIVSFETASVPPREGPAILVGLPAGGEQRNDALYPVAVIGHGFQGLLTSPSTRLPGIVSIADIAPTALGHGDALGWKPEAHAAARVIRLDRLIREKKDARLASGLVAAGLLVLLAFVFPRASALAYSTALTANLVLGATETATFWIVLLAIGLSIAAAWPLALAVRTTAALGLALAAVLVLYLCAFAIDGSWIAFSPWGPPQNGRFYGVSNLLETMLLVPVLAGAALLGLRFGRLAFAAVALLAFVVVAGNRFGADGGGALVLAAGYAVLAALLAGLRGRRFAAALAGAAVLAGGIVALDAATGGSSHVTRAIGGGPETLASHFGDRLIVSWERATLGPGPAAAVFLSLAALAILVARLLASDRALAERALPLAFAAAVLVSLVVNDSPGDVAVTGLVGYLVCEAVMLRARCAAASCSRSAWAFFWPAAVERGLSRPRPRP
jgi:hypothetical protein